MVFLAAAHAACLPDGVRVVGRHGFESSGRGERGQGRKRGRERGRAAVWNLMLAEREVGKPDVRSREGGREGDSPLLSLSFPCLLTRPPACLPVRSVGRSEPDG